MICQANLEKLGKAAYNSLSADDKLKYTAASKVVSIVSDVVKNGVSNDTIADVGTTLAQVGFNLGSTALIALATSVSKKDVKTISEAITILSGYVINSLAKLIDQVKHELAARLATLLGIDGNPGIIGAILEFVYRAMIKPVQS